MQGEILQVNSILSSFFDVIISLSIRSSLLADGRLLLQKYQFHFLLVFPLQVAHCFICSVQHHHVCRLRRFWFPGKKKNSRFMFIRTWGYCFCKCYVHEYMWIIWIKCNLLLRCCFSFGFLYCGCLHYFRCSRPIASTEKIKEWRQSMKKRRLSGYKNMNKFQKYM